jgi:hypothetical protein
MVVYEHHHGLLSFFVCFIVYVLCMLSTIALYVLFALDDRCTKSILSEDWLRYTSHDAAQNAITLSSGVIAWRCHAMDQAHCGRA